MDKVHKKITKGRLSIAVAMVVCMAIVAMPALAYAAPTLSNQFPAGTITAAPAVVGATVTSPLALDAKSGVITVTGVTGNRTGVTNIGSTFGSWSAAESWVDGVRIITWTWASAARDATKGSIYTFPGTLTDGLKSVSATVKDAAGASGTSTWTFTVSAAPSFGVVSPAADADVSAPTTITAAFSDNDPVAGATATATIDAVDVAATVADGVVSIVPSPALTNGAHSVTVTVTNAGLSTTKTWGFTVSPVPGLSIACLACHVGYDAVPAMGPDCVPCHDGMSAPHGFDQGFGPGTLPASTHNTPEFGNGGMKSKFDGTQGVTLVTNEGGIVNTTWGVPTTKIFWQSGDASMPVGAMTGFTPTSPVTCVDCHTGLEAAGPHGSAENWGIDPNFPAPYDLAVLSSTVASGIKYRTANTLTGQSAESTNATLVDGGIGGGSGVICAKCHDLKESQASDGEANTAHANGNHLDRANGQSDCISCHIAIPHAWKRPRMLAVTFAGDYIRGGGTTGIPTSYVSFTKDPAPYVPATNFRGSTRTGGSAGAPYVSPQPGAAPGFTGIGMGPISAQDPHSLNASGTAVWASGWCIGCADHYGSATATAKLQ